MRRSKEKKRERNGGVKRRKTGEEQRDGKIKGGGKEGDGKK